MNPSTATRLIEVEEAAKKASLTLDALSILMNPARGPRVAKASERKCRRVAARRARKANR